MLLLENPRTRGECRKWMACVRVCVSVCVCVCYLQVLVQLVHQTGEELVGVLLFSHKELLIPHLKDLEHQRKTQIQI